MADAAARAALTLPGRGSAILTAQELARPLKKCISQRWQAMWDESPASKLKYIKKEVNSWASSNRGQRREEVIFARLRIGHTRLTHSYLITRDVPPICPRCNLGLSIRHIFEECAYYKKPLDQLNIPYDVRKALRDCKSDVDKSIYDTWWKHLLAGSMAGVVSRTCTAPLDRLKVFAQVTGRFYHPVKGIVKIVKTDGVLSLWRGNGINMLKITPETASKFLVYEYTKLKMGAEEKSLSIWERFICAACAGVVSQTLIYPIEVLKTRMVIRQGREEKHSLKNVYKTLIRNRGHIGLFKGYFSTIVGIVLFTGTDLCTYETTKVFLQEKILKDPADLPLPIILISGIFSCITGQAVAYPLSMASTAVQASEKKVEARDILYERFKQGGIYGWYRGSSMSYLKALPAVSITYLVYELALNQLGAHMTH